MAWANLTDVRCYYEVTGQGDPLLLVPGLGVTASVWDPVAPELAEHFTLILVDNRGIGRSQAKRQPTTLSDYTADLIELLDLLQVERTHVLGLSLGGVIAQRLAVDHPSRVDRLVLASCTDRFSPYLRHVALLLGQTLRRQRAKAFARTIEVLGSSPRYVDSQPEMVEQRVAEKVAQRIPPRAIGRQLRCLASADNDPRHDPVRAPTLVIAGEHDFLIPSCYAREMAARIPGSRFILVPGAGHNPLVECPEQVLPWIIDFMKNRGSSHADSVEPAWEPSFSQSESPRLEPQEGQFNDPVTYPL
jgi:pimeloyl-ACP methyl ester carboxylesterase